MNYLGVLLLLLTLTGHLAASLLIWYGTFEKQKFKPITASSDVVYADKIFRDKIFRIEAVA